MTINITHPIISPPSYELKTSRKGWFMQIGFRDSLSVQKFHVHHEFRPSVDRSWILALNNLWISCSYLFALSYMAFPAEISQKKSNSSTNQWLVNITYCMDHTLWYTTNQTPKKVTLVKPDLFLSFRTSSWWRYCLSHDIQCSSSSQGSADLVTHFSHEQMISKYCVISIEPSQSFQTISSLYEYAVSAK